MGKKQKINESYDEELENEEIINESEENINDSFEDKNRDLIEGSENDESEEDDINAWGYDKKKYYKSDEESNSDIEEEEEKEANDLWKRKAELLNEDDFVDKEIEKQENDDEIFVYDKKKEKKKEIQLEEENNDIFENSPELKDLLQDYKKYIIELKNRLEPLKKAYISKSIELSDEIKNFMGVKYSLLTGCCLNIIFYLRLKNTNNFTPNHEVIEKLLNFKTNIKKIVKIEKKLKPEIDQLLKDLKRKKTNAIINGIKINDSENMKITEKKLKTQNLNINQEKKNIRKEKLEKIYKIINDENEEKRFEKKSSKQKNKNESKNNIFNDSDSEILDIEDEDDYYNEIKSKKSQKKKKIKEEKQAIEKEIFEKHNIEEVKEDEGRGITYQILKNKGLIRKRKKIDRNSRVKLRKKFEKNKQKLKSKGIFLRKKESTYKGELTGINAGVIRGVKYS